MSRVRLLATVALLFGWCLASAQPVLDGDIIFQDSGSEQTPAIQFATKSKYSHCGVVLLTNGKPYVFEAASRVTFTPLKAWIEDGVDGHYVVMRLRDRERGLTKQALEGMRAAANDLERKPYDVKFLWGNDKIYCSELVWKLYEKGAGIKLTALRRFRDYDRSHPKVKAKLKERFGGTVPLDELVVAPVDILKSSLLVEAVRGRSP